MRCRAAAVLVLAQTFCAAALLGGEITSGSLQIQGVALAVDTAAVTTGIDIPTTIQTRFGGRTNDTAQSVEGLLAVGDLTGPGIDPPIQLTTAPGFKFQIPGLPQEGLYVLQNVRLMKDGEFIAPATPGSAAITVANLLQTSVTVRQLTPDELRARGINLDGTNFNVYDYSFTFLLASGETITVPFSVAIDSRTHEVTPVARENPFVLPVTPGVTPPRWVPPDVIPFELPADPQQQQNPAQGQDPLQTSKPARHPSIPAAIVIPNSLAVLHEFLAVILTITNGAPAGSPVRLDDVHATVRLPQALRTAKSNPSVAFGQPVPVVDTTNGVTFLVAQARGSAEWDLEGLQPGTHTVELEVRATLKEAGQDDVPLKATPRASIVIHDPRFNINFSHPDTIRKGIDYSTFTFITNLSGSTQTIRISNGVPSCDQSPGANVCRTSGADSDQLTLANGEMQTIEYRLRPGITGHVFATAGSIDNPDTVSAAVQLQMGVSESGVPLSPATLVMPYYAQFVSPGLLDANLQLLGIGYSLATAPVNQVTAKLPRVIRSDVFYRAGDIARAGQRIFISSGAPDPKRDALAHLALDLLGNSTELREWDDLRRQEKSGRAAGAAVIAELNTAGMAGRGSVGEFVDLVAAASSVRSPFVMAVAHGPAVAQSARPYALSLRGASGRRADVPNEAASGWIRDLPFADISRFDVAALNRQGEIALAGRWTEDVDVVVTPAVSGPLALDVVFPGASDGTAMRAHLDLSGTAGEPVRVPLTRGAQSLSALLPNGGFAATATATAVVPAPIQIAGVRQDLNLDPDGHKVSVLFNRPVAIEPGGDWLTKFAATIAFNRDGVAYNGARPIYAAAMQDDSRVVNLSFDATLTTNAAYTISTAPLLDPTTGSPVAFGAVPPKIDNDRPAGIVYGKFLRGDNTPVGAAEVRLFTGHFQGCQIGIMADEPAADCNPYREAPQYVKSEADGTFLFEFIPRDPIGDPGLSGSYRLLGVSSSGRYTIVDGAVRLPGRVQFVNLQLLGRGAAEGTATYDNGAKVVGASVYVGSTMFGIGRQTATDANGFFHVDDLPVGPITFSVTDAAGNVAYASGEIATPGELVAKQLVIYRKPMPGTGTVFGVIRRSDTNVPVVAARVGVYSQGYGLAEALTDNSGRFEFRKVPAGFVTVLAAEWSVSRQSIAVDFDLHNDEVHETDLTLSVAPPADATATLGGDVVRENPLFPGDSSRYEKVAGAIVRLAGHPVTADANGHFTFDSLPLAFSNRPVTAYDPATKRSGSSNVPTLTEAGPNNVTIFMPANSFGNGTVRVLLVSATGQPVDGFRVLSPGFPPAVFAASGAGVYVTQANVGADVPVYAVPGPAAYGDQFAQTSVHLDFPGQVASVTLRLPGQGTVRAKLHGDFDLIGNVNLTYLAWDEAEQAPQLKTRTLSTSENGIAGYATFADPKVPASQTYTVETADAANGYASQTGTLAFEGDLATHTLQLNKLASIGGAVYAIDGKTPIAGAAVQLDDGKRNTGVVTTAPDGTFLYRDVPADTAFSIRADATQSGVYRTGIAYGRTAAAGGPLDGVAVIMQRRGNVEGVVVDANGVPVPQAKVWLRELDFPQRSFGTDLDPATADINGRFAFSNVFVGAMRAKAWDASNPDLQGNWSGAVEEEGQTVTISIPIGAGGTGGIQVTVTDPNQLNAPVANAEVRLYRGGVFDTTSTDGNGTATFQQVPAGAYSISAYSKALGKSGSTTAFDVVRDLVTETRVLLEFSGKVDGTLTDPESVPPGSGVPGAPVTLTASAYQTRTSTSMMGAYTFDGIREGFFTLTAKDTVTNRRATASHTLSAADPHPVVNLELEPTETLHVAVYLPDDTGANSGILAGPVSIDVKQRYGDFMRSAQGNPIMMPKLFAWEPYGIAVREIGGQQRELAYTGSFPKGSAADPVQLVYPAYGDVDVTVTQNGAPAAGARVVVAGGRSVTLFTDATGKVTATGLLLGNVSAQATSIDGAFSGSTSGALTRQSAPVRLSIDLGAYAGVTGVVQAEAGGASVGTRVIASFAGRTLEAITDGNGRYTFLGIPSSVSTTVVALAYIGPDGTTIGARQTVTIGIDAASKVVTVPAVKLDATPPQVVSISPVDGAQSVSPDSLIRIAFSEPIRDAQIARPYLQLVPADGSAQVITTFDPPVVASDGTFVVTMRPPPPPVGQKFPLKSNTLYRIVVSGAIEDLTGHRILSALGTTFTTSDYTEPRVIKVVPAVTTPVPEQATFEFHFNEPVTGSIAFHLYKISAPGSAGQVITEKPGHAYIDPATALTLFFAPNDPVEPESFYRAVFSGIQDLQGNPSAEQTFHFFSFDKTAPYVKLVSPVPDAYPLISGLEYVLNVDLRNGTADAAPATDVASVDYYRVEGATETYLTTMRAGPFAYRFVAPDAPDGGIPYSLRAKATDLSGNAGAPATITWTVKPNQPPANVAVAFNPASAYPSTTVAAAVSFDDEGTFATVALTERATKLDGTAYSETQTKQVTRPTVGDAWPVAQFAFSLPPNLNPSLGAAFTATVTDVRGSSTSNSVLLPLLADSTKPSVVSMTPAAETTYRMGDTFVVEATVSDAETGVAEVDFAIDGQLYRVTATAPSTGMKTFDAPRVTVPAKNSDTRVPIIVTAIDYQGNSSSKSFDVIYSGVNDPTVPKAVWLCPIDRAVLPAGQSNYSLPLRVSATDDIAITSVQFRISGVADPIPATQSSPNEYTATAVIATMPPAGSSFTITAIVNDANAAHTVELPISIDVVAIDIAVDATQSITADNLSLFDGKSILVRTPAGRLVLHVPVTLRNLVVVDGARVDTLAGDFVNLTIVDRAYIDCASTIDESARGTVGNLTNAGGSHGGLGAGPTNAAFDSLFDPSQAGTGGSTGVGGGVISLRTSTASDAIARIVVAGSLRADGASANGAGAGGSIRVGARDVIVGPSARITANGGDAAPDGAGGGGRIAITATERLDLPAVLEVRGGNNGGGAGTMFIRRPGQANGELGIGTSTSATPVRATPLGLIGSGTATSIGTNSLTDSSKTFDAGVVGQSLLLDRTYRVVAVSADGHTLSTDPAGGPLAGGPAYRGVIATDRIEVGANSLARFDDSFTIKGVLDDRAAAVNDSGAVLLSWSDRPALSTATIPPAGSDIIRAASLDVAYSASSAAGLSATTLNFSAVSPAVVDTLAAYPTSVASRHVAIVAPPAATLGPATLAVHVVDRADRSADAPVVNFNVVDNQPPTIDAFSATPDTLYPGHSIAVSLAASDDVALTRVSIVATIGGTASTQSVTPNTKSAAPSFTVAVPITTPGNTTMTIDALLEDAYPGRAATKQTKAITILKDTVAPSVTITAPAANQLFNEGTGNLFTVTVSAVDGEVGVKSVNVAAGDGAPVSLSAGSANQWTGTVPVPNVDGVDPVAVPLVVTASDYEGNSESATTTIQVKPLIDPNAPAIAWTCSTTGAMVPAASAANLRVFAKGATAGNGIQKVDFYIDGSTTAVLATAVSGVADQYETIYTVPALPEGTPIKVRAVATSVAGNTSDLSTTINVVADGIVAIHSNVTIDATNASSYDGKTVVVQSGTVILSGTHTFDRLIVLNGAAVTHAAGGGNKVEFTTTRGLYVACGGAVDASGRGYVGGQTYPGATIGGSGDGGSHIGVGGLYNPPTSSTFGSVYHPQESGGGGDASISGSPGGGVVRVTAATVIDDGAIRANGTVLSGQDRGGAGGSVWITAGRISGAGSIEANGAGPVTFGSGAGGAIAIEWTDAASVMPALTARSGANANAPRLGGAGSIYTKGPSATFGSLVIDNGSTAQPVQLPALGRGIAQAGTSNTTIVTDRATAIPAYFAGGWLEITDATSGALIGMWRISGVSGRTITIAPNGGETIDVAPGRIWRGVYRFDSLKLRSATLTTEDRLVLGAPADLDGSSSILGNNQGAPLLDLSKMSLQTSSAGTSVIGVAGATTDVDTPITVTAANARTGQAFATTASANGAFVVAVQGNAGDTITIKAKDANLFPLETALLTVGTLPSAAPAGTQLSKGSWTTDGGFSAQTVALDGTTLAVGSWSDIDGSASDKLVILDVTDPAHPVFVRTIATGLGPLRALTVANGWAYVAGSRFGTIDLRSATPTVNLACARGGNQPAIAIADGYAFTAENYLSDGRIWVYDVSNPSTPFCLSEQRPLVNLGMDNTVYSDLLAYGARNLVGISNGASGWDVVVLDRADVNDIKLAGRLQIPNFIATRGRIRGSLLYLVSRTAPEMVVVDLANPAAPVVAARVTLPASAGGIRLLEDTTLAAATSSGVLATTLDPASLTVSGAAATGGVAMDVVAAGAYAYVANEIGIAVVPIDVAPVIDASHITMSMANGALTVAGAPRAITTAAPPLSIAVANGTESMPASVSPDGSFSASIGARPGDRITVQAGDAHGRISGPVPLGGAPFFAIASDQRGTRDDDANFFARRVAGDGTNTVASNGTLYGAQPVQMSTRITLLKQPNASDPPAVVGLDVAAGPINDEEVRSSYAYVAADRFAVVDLTATMPVRYLADIDPIGREYSVAISGNYAFTAEGGWTRNGTIFVYDISSPAAPKLVKTQALATGSGVDYRKLIVSGTLLFAISTDANRDLTVIDISNPAAPVRLAELDVPNFTAFNGTVDGAVVYLTGGDAGVAVVDVSTPSAPRVLSIVDTPGIAFAATVSGTNEVAVADASAGITFLDTSDKQHPIVMGSQSLQGSATDVRVVGGHIFAATETRFYVLNRP